MIAFEDLKGIDPQSNPLHDSTGGEMLLPLVRQIPIDKIKPDPEQPRRRVDVNGPAWTGLVESIARHGVLQPIIVRPEPSDGQGYMIVCGERRWLAARSLGQSHIMARIMRSTAEAGKRMEVQVLENAVRQGLNPLDEMEACMRLVKAEGWTYAELGRRLGVTKQLVTEIMKLDRIHPEARQVIRGTDRSFSRREMLRIAAQSSTTAQLGELEHIVNGQPPSRKQRETLGAKGRDRRKPHEIKGHGFRCYIAQEEAQAAAADEVVVSVEGKRSGGEIARVLVKIAHQLWRGERAAIGSSAC